MQAQPPHLEDGGRRLGHLLRLLLALELIRQADKAVAAAPRLHRLRQDNERGVETGSVEGPTARCWVSGHMHLRQRCPLAACASAQPALLSACSRRLTCPGATDLAGALTAGRRAAGSPAGCVEARRPSTPDGARSSGDVERRAPGSGAYPSCLAFFMGAAAPVLQRARGPCGPAAQP